MLIAFLAILSGAFVGFFLSLLGGGGSIMAVPLLLYVVGVSDPHIAIGTSAVAVAASAAMNLAMHAHRGTVKWPCAIAFAISGSIGALGGAALGKATNGQYLILAFAAAMVGVGITMLMRKSDAGDPNVHISPKLAVRLIPTGLVTGAASGFFGIGGGFLIVPGLIGASNMTMLHAIGTSLVAVTAFGAATATSYAMSGLVDWTLAILFMVGGAVGSYFGQFAGRKFEEKKGALNKVFAVFIFLSAAYMALQSFNVI